MPFIQWVSTEEQWVCDDNLQWLPQADIISGYIYAELDDTEIDMIGVVGFGDGGWWYISPNLLLPRLAGLLR